MIAANIARRYAKALFEIGSEVGNLDELVAEFSSAAKMYSESDEVKNALENPLVPHAGKKAILNEIAGQLGMSAVVTNTLQILTDRRRVSLLPSIAQLLHELSDARKGIVRAEVTAATPLDEPYRAKLQARLEAMTGHRIALDVREDPALLGGVITRIGDTVYDGSVRARLNELKHTLFTA